MRILLVDDDAGVVSALTAVLNTIPGHEMRSAHTAEEAQSAAVELGGVDLLITDVVMEPTDGFTLRDQLTTQYPNLRTILISGYDLSDYPEQTRNHQLLGKPIDAEALRAAVEKELPAAPVAVAAESEAVAIGEPPLAEVPPPQPEAVAEPVPAPTPIPSPVPVAVPVANPVAVPVARPAAVPVPVPVARPTVVAKAVPTPTTPTATPSVKATPVARPAAVATPTAPQPVAKPQAVPVSATPKVAVANPPAVTVKATAIPQPAATAAPSAPAAVPPPPAIPVAGTPTVRVAATVKAQPVPPPSGPGSVPVARPVAKSAPGVAVPGAKPVATPGLQPKAPSVAVPASGAVQTKALTPTAVPVSVPAHPTVVAAPVSAPSLTPAPIPSSGEDLSGRMLGAYQLLRKTGESRWGGIYAGTQTSINRSVAIEVLDTSKAADETAQARFVADARAKAAVQHPSILAVYEAGEAEGRFFYAYEYVDGQTIAELKAAGHRLDEPTALKVLRVAADGLSYFNVHHTPHTPPEANSISLGSDGHPRLANLATQLADETLTPPQEIQALGRVMLGVLPAIQALSPGLREILKRMVQAGPQALTSWGQLLQGIKALEPKIVPTDAAKISAQDRAAIAAVEQARKQQKRSLYYNIASVGVLFLLVGATVWYFLRNKQRIYDEQVQVPAGEFIFANGVKKNLPDFWIDKYEVTFGQYAEFVKALEKHPTTEFDHKDQPRLKNAKAHKPDTWEIYYGRARDGLPVHSTPIDLSCPVLDVDFWDAYAYAKWKGRELPTEEEWEKAARGTKGLIYPWGDEPDLKKVNSNADFHQNDPAAIGEVDGFNFWNPVDKILGDKSPYGVMGMAGNLREWTATWDMQKKRPIVKGGCFRSSDVRLDLRLDLDPSAHDETLGFRTISRTPPTK